MLTMDSNGSSNSSFPNSSWVDCGIDWKGTSRMAGPLDPWAPLLLAPSALEAPWAAARVCLGAWGFGSFDIPAVSTFGKLEDGFSINTITGNSGDDWLDPSELLCTQLRKSWIWSFSCAGRYWILSQARVEIRKLRQIGWNQKNIIFLLASINMRNLSLQQRSRSCFPFLAAIRSSIYWRRRHTIPRFIILLQNKQRIHQMISNFNFKYSTVCWRSLTTHFDRQLLHQIQP